MNLQTIMELMSKIPPEILILFLTSRGLIPFIFHPDVVIEHSMHYCQIERRSRSPGKNFNEKDRRLPRSVLFPLYVSHRPYWIIFSIFSIGCFITSAFSLTNQFKNQKNSPPTSNLISKLLNNK